MMDLFGGSLAEDESGKLIAVADPYADDTKRRRVEQPVVRRGVVRFLIVVVDMSECMKEVDDMKPSRMYYVRNCLEQFVGDFTDQNPISHISLVGMYDGKAEVITDLSGNKRHHVEKLREKIKNKGVMGNASLQNALSLGNLLLSNTPAHGSREMLFIFGSMSSVDPGNLFTVLDETVHNKIRVSIVGISAEVFVCKKIASATGGTYFVSKDAEHFRHLLADQAPPLPTHLPKNAGGDGTSIPASAIRMGFPQRLSFPHPVFCSCHPRQAVESLPTSGYACPRCKNIVCDLPINCPVCDLTLVASSHLARSYHHLFPVPLFDEIRIEEAKQCSGCLDTLRPGPAYRCSGCQFVYCAECDVYIHDSLHVCAGCSQIEKKSSDRKKERQKQKEQQQQQQQQQLQPIGEDGQQ